MIKFVKRGSARTGVVCQGKGPDRTPFDGIVRIMLKLVDKCLLNRRQLVKYWGELGGWGRQRMAACRQ